MSKGRPKKGFEKQKVVDDIPEDNFEEEEEEIEEEEEDLDSELDFDNHKFTDEFMSDYDD